MKWFKNERGSIEVVILVLVFAAAIGLIAWRIADTYNSQSDAESAAASANNAPDTTATYVSVSELKFSFINPESAGDISYAVSKTDNKVITLTSSNLKEKEYTCDDENTGEMGTITVAAKTEAQPVPAPSYTKTVGDKEYRYSSAIQQKCYDEAVVDQFNTIIPKVIMNSIKED